MLKRAERIKLLMAKGMWAEKMKVFGLPKTKIVRMKLAKKEKKQETLEKPEADQAAAKKQ